MRRLGRVIHISKTESIILRTKKIPAIGASVVDKSLDRIGTVTDVFGPVKYPYVAVSPAGKVDKKRLPNTVLYLYEE
ncbi:MAG: H/ACA ribonucleoprotein complex subunit GAR1 [Promethearchaeia archaeon]